MALLNSLNSADIGIALDNVYYRLHKVDIRYSKHKAQPRDWETHIILQGFARKPELEEHLVPLSTLVWNVDVSEIDAVVGDTFLSKVYNWIVQQPEMVGAVGV